MNLKQKTELLEKVLEEIKRKTIQDCIKIIPYTQEQTSATQSNYFGIPYVTCLSDIPKNEEGKQLTLLTQINLSELPQNELLPKKGILQFWIDGTHDTLGAEWCKKDKHTRNKIVYVKEYGSVDIERVKQIYNSKVNMNMFPIDKPYLLRFEVVKQCITPNDYKYDSLVVNGWNSIVDNESDKVENIFGFDSKMEEMIFAVRDMLYGQIGGYPVFAQEDPRYDEKYDVLLLQIDSQKTDTGRIMWGDSGVCNFFINSESLKNEDFTDFLYNWDCC